MATAVENASPTVPPADRSDPAITQRLPLAISLAGVPCLVVGGGRIGTHKALILAGAGARVTVISPKISASLRKHVDHNSIQWRQAEYEDAQLDGFVLVVAATSSPKLNLHIGQAADARGVLSCVVSSARRSRIAFPAVFTDEQVVVAVHSNGQDYRLSQRIRDDVAALLSAAPGKRNRKRLAILATSRIPRVAPQSPPKQGQVFIVGAGPGAPDLISLRGLRALRAAEAVLADRLVPRSFLAELGVSARGKILHWLGDDRPHWSQQRINHWLESQARSGHTVARLKNGDPLVFGRGDSEIEHLSGCGIPWELIPGASAAVAVPTAAGLPLTRHAAGLSFAVATARLTGGAVEDAFPQADSLVLLMGVAVLDQIVARLLAQGWPRETSAALVQRGTLPFDQHVVGPLAQLPALAKRANVSSPALLIVGQAAQPISAISRRLTILFTGLDPTHYRAIGNLLHWPALAAVPDPQAESSLPDVLASLQRHRFDGVVFADPLGLSSFLMAINEQRLDARVLAGVQIITAGRETSQRLAEYGLTADAQSDSPDAIRAILGDARHRSLLVVSGASAPVQLRTAMEPTEASLVFWHSHRLIPHPELGRPLPDHDVIFFTDPTAVDVYWATYGQDAFRRPAWSLGNATHKALTDHGIRATSAAMQTAPTLAPVPLGSQ